MPMTAREMIKHLQENGFEIKSQRGSHIKLYHPETGKTVIVPNHAKDLKKDVFATDFHVYDLFLLLFSINLAKIIKVNRQLTTDKSFF